MSLDLCFWVLMIIWAGLSLLVHFAVAPTLFWREIGLAVNAVLLFVMFVLLGWQTFGPPLHR